MKKLRFPLAGLVLLGTLSIASAKDVEAIPGKDYPITPEAGPWLVCVATFRPVPPRAGGQPTPPGVLAQELALYLRHDLKIPAYVFDHGREEREKQRAEFERIRELCPGGKVRITRVEEQFAVMVGGYKDDEAAHKAMVEVKKWKQPPDQFCDIAFVAKPGKQGGYEMEQTFINPFSTAFVAHNPSVPRERPDSRAADPFLKSLNEGESLSLLNCKKPWTLAVKSFAGATAIQPQTSGSKFLDLIGLGGKNGEQLGAAGLQAHELANFLRKYAKLDAYVLHTRSNSVVTVGNFERIDDPQLIAMQRMMTGFEMKGLVDPNMQLFAQPLPMEVPRP